MFLPDALILPFITCFIAAVQLVLFAIVLLCGRIVPSTTSSWRTHARHLSLTCWILWWLWLVYFVYYVIAYRGRLFVDVGSDVYSAVAVQAVVCLFVYYALVFVESVTAFVRLNVRTLPNVADVIGQMRAAVPALNMKAVCWHFTMSGCTINDHQPRTISKVIQVPFDYDSWSDVTGNTLPVSRHGLTRIDVQVVVHMGDSYTQQCFDTAFLHFRQGNHSRDKMVDFSIVHSLSGTTFSGVERLELTCSGSDSVPGWINLSLLLLAALLNVAFLYRAAIDSITTDAQFCVVKSVITTPRHESESLPPQDVDTDCLIDVTPTV